MFARLARLGWINDFYLGMPFWMPNALMFIMYYNYHCENLVTIFTLLHRLMAVANPLRNEQVGDINSEELIYGEGREIRTRLMYK